MKQIRLSILAVIAVLIGIRLFSPAVSTPAPTSDIQTREFYFGVAKPSDPQIQSDAAYHVAYLLSRDAVLEDDILKPENLFKDFTGHKISVVYTWQDLLKTASAQRIDALVLHDSAVSMVNFETMANAYWHGITISTLGVRPTMLAHLYDNACLSFGYWMPVPDPEENVYFTISTHTILSLQNQASNWYRRDWRRNCDWPRPAELIDPYGWAISYTSGPINKESQDLYRELMLGHIENAETIHKEFEKEHKK